jgi:hypothetical protein
MELNLSVEAEREGGGTAYDAPRFDANLGVGSRLQLKLELPWRVATGTGGSARAGVGNVETGVKWRFAEAGRLALSTYPQLTLGGSEDATSKGIADSGTAVLLPVEAAWDLGPVSLNAEAGYLGKQDADEIVYGLAIAHAPWASLELLGECHGGGAADLSGQGVLCGAGFRLAPARGIGLLVALSFAVAGSAEDRPGHRLYSGVQLRW